MTPRKQAETPAIRYTDALQELDEILAEIEGSEVDLDRLAGRVERAAHLVRLLKTRIKETELKVARVVEELAEESGAASAPGEAAGDAPAAGADEGTAELFDAGGAAGADPEPPTS